MKRSDIGFSKSGTLEELQEQLQQAESFIDDIESKVKKVIDHIDVSKRGKFGSFSELTDYISDIGDGIEWLNDIAEDLY